MGTTSRFVAFALTVGWVGLASGACSFAVNTSAVQCLSEAECLAKGPAFANTTCDPTTKTCVPLDPTAGLCKTNQDCIDANAGSAAICRKTDHKCVLLATAECPIVRGSPTDIANDNSVVIGTMTLFSSQETIEEEAAVAMALSEFSKATGGLPPVAGSTAVRPIVGVSCNEGRGTLDAATNHLVNDLQVPLIIGPLQSADGAVVLSQYTLPHQILTILPGANTSSLGSLPNPAAPTPMVWLLDVSDTVLTALGSSFLNDDLCVPTSDNSPGCDPTKSRLVTRGIVPAGAPIKVMVIQDGNIFGLSLTSALQKQLTFNCSLLAPGPCGASDNGAPTPPANWSGSWPEYAVGNLGDLSDPVATPDPNATASKVVAAALAFKPNVIFWASAPSQKAFKPLEQQWGAANPSVPFPIEILTNDWENAPAALTVVSAPYAVASDLRHRLFFVSSKATTSSLVSDFNVRFQTANPQFTGAISLFTDLYYDAAYVSFYSMAAVGSAPLTGVNIGNALAAGKLNPPGTVIDADPTELQQGLGIISAGKNIDFNGVSGPLDFNVSNGTIETDGEIQCYDSTLTVQSSGYVWDHTTGKGTGSVTNCN